MEPNLFMQGAVGLLALSGMGGVAMAIVWFGGTPQPPAWLAVLHGFLASAAMTLLLYAAFTIGLPWLARTALVLLLLAASGGALLSVSHHGKPIALSNWRLGAPAGIAVLGFLLLMGATFMPRA